MNTDLCAFEITRTKLHVFYDILIKFTPVICRIVCLMKSGGIKMQHFGIYFQII